MSIEQKVTEDQFTPAVESRMRLAVFVKTLLLPDYSIRDVLYTLTTDASFRDHVMRILEKHQAKLIKDLFDTAGFEEEE